MKHTLILLLAIFVTGTLTYILTPRPYRAHHHANMAVYIDGKMMDFSSSVYMEETSRCDITTDIRPEDRIHLHDGKGSLVHVHMAASTWGDLFANISWNIGNGVLVDPYGQIRIASGSTSLTYVINGKKVDNAANMVVGSTDRLLIWYGTGTVTEIEAKAETLIDADAHEYNNKSDPASCSTNTYGWLSPIALPIMEWIEHA
jgi:hypothetical protein